MPKDGGGFEYEYFIKDHPPGGGQALGNTRLTVQDSSGIAAIKQEDHYYPFGLVMSGQSWQSTNYLENRYLYNGKEMQDNLGLDWYDYGARFYDATLGRFFTQDRFAEKYFNLAPYQYAANNPIKFIDVNGDSIYINYTTRERRTGFLSGIFKYKTFTHTITCKIDMDGLGNEFADNVINSLNTLNAELDKIDNEFSSMVSDIANSDKMGLQISSYDKANGASCLTKRALPVLNRKPRVK